MYNGSLKLLTYSNTLKRDRFGLLVCCLNLHC